MSTLFGLQRLILKNTLDGFPRAHRIDILDTLRQTRLLDSEIKC